MYSKVHVIDEMAKKKAKNNTNNKATIEDGTSKSKSITLMKDRIAIAKGSDGTAELYGYHIWQFCLWKQKKKVDAGRLISEFYPT